MTRSHTWPAVVIATGVALACTPKESGPQLWTKACERGLKTVSDSSVEAQRECEQSMAAHPARVADDMSRCLLKGPPAESKEAETAAFQACISASTQKHLADRARAHELLDTLDARLDELRGPSIPERLSELPGAPSRGPWGFPIDYAIEGEDYRLCIVGPDGARGTADDICRQRPFIYFQF
jgi:hypothetical protein